ncbi:pyridoxal phosphate-dependent aminotransferase [Streptomyces sp. AC563]|uniref:pyridoxal phosphate-dependent aminotransferase n=1 Tax=Streptomyces buecherae TaxID=2763006 RepID=UPI00164EAEEF|nr:pyridoxal phosphate-dependent aminotransferase [Streptomyces buecherae]MBC3990540.1 pyridoxal phosphate-dependent aminotransferase [Streptomyces buecherae]
MSVPADVIEDSDLYNPYEDTELLREAATGRELDDVIYLSLGETWSRVAPGLVSALEEGLPPHSHGYVLSPYGLPALRRVLRALVPAEHGLPHTARPGEDFDVAVSQGGTRNAMFHFGRLLGRRSHEPAARPAVVCPSPGWDYPGVFSALGYDVHRFGLEPGAGYQPDPHDVAHALRKARAGTSGPLLLVINAQHNPTGANWTGGAVRAMVRAALEVEAGVLVDDAYYALHDPGTVPVSALRILLEEFGPLPAARRPPWLAVRSLSKQFHCNGWGIGALTGPPAVLEHLLGRLLPEYAFVSAVPLQAAMATWLRSRESRVYLATQRGEYARKRAHMAEHLAGGLGYPRDAFFVGPSGPYLLMRTPPWYDDRKAESYRSFCLRRSGVLLGEGHMTTPGTSPVGGQGQVRLFLGPSRQTLTRAVRRMAAAGLTWHGGSAPSP